MALWEADATAERGGSCGGSRCGVREGRRYVECHDVVVLEQPLDETGITRSVPQQNIGGEQTWGWADHKLDAGGWCRCRRGRRRTFFRDQEMLQEGGGGR
jgi:hypothetical protein